MSPRKPIKTARLLLRPIERGDVDGLLPLIQNWSVVRWLAVVPWPYTRMDMVRFIEDIALPNAARGHPIYTIVLDYTPIGTAACRGERSASARQRDISDLGYWLGEPYWGRGYATEAIAGLIGRVFEDPEVDLIRSGVFEGNDASLNVQRKLGFEVLETVKVMCRAQGRELPHVCTRLTRSAFLARRGG
jgi:RimJ/RimL family protein N-acetyltransferase